MDFAQPPCILGNGDAVSVTIAIESSLPFVVVVVVVPHVTPLGQCHVLVVRHIAFGTGDCILSFCKGPRWC